MYGWMDGWMDGCYALTREHVPVMAQPQVSMSNKVHGHGNSHILKGVNFEAQSGNNAISTEYKPNI
jgi:hypothetical protein